MTGWKRYPRGIDAREWQFHHEGLMVATVIDWGNDEPLDVWVRGVNNGNLSCSVDGSTADAKRRALEMAAEECARESKRLAEIAADLQHAMTAE